MKFFVSIITFFLISSVTLADVTFYGVEVPDKLFEQLLCTSDSELLELVEQGEIKTYDEEELFISRAVVIENLRNEGWIPRNQIEKNDYCVVTEVLLARNRDCGSLSVVYLQKLRTKFCSLF